MVLGVNPGEFHSRQHIGYLTLATEAGSRSTRGKGYVERELVQLMEQSHLIEKAASYTYPVS